MKRVFALPESAELELLNNMLEKAGIRCALRNDGAPSLAESAAALFAANHCYVRRRKKAVVTKRSARE